VCAKRPRRRRQAVKRAPVDRERRARRRAAAAAAGGGPGVGLVELERVCGGAEHRRKDLLLQGRRCGAACAATDHCCSRGAALDAGTLGAGDAGVVAVAIRCAAAAACRRRDSRGVRVARRRARTREHRRAALARQVAWPRPAQRRAVRRRQPWAGARQQAQRERGVAQPGAELGGRRAGAQQRALAAGRVLPRVAVAARAAAVENRLAASGRARKGERGSAGRSSRAVGVLWFRQHVCARRCHCPQAPPPPRRPPVAARALVAGRARERRQAALAV
jgi:hypothetical protein